MAQFYNQLKQEHAGPQLEIIFISEDENCDRFNVSAPAFTAAAKPRIQSIDALRIAQKHFSCVSGAGFCVLV